jgi:hypothetical protein
MGVVDQQTYLCQRHHMFIEKQSLKLYSTPAEVVPALYNLRFYKHANPLDWDEAHYNEWNISFPYKLN